MGGLGAWGLESSRGEGRQDECCLLLHEGQDTLNTFWKFCLRQRNGIYPPHSCQRATERWPVSSECSAQGRGIPAGRNKG